jgi:hypothetical protein
MQIMDNAAGLPAVTAQNVLSDDVIAAAFDIEDALEREKYLGALRKAAQEARQVATFNSLLKAHHGKRVEMQKGRDSRQIAFTGAPLEGLKCGQWICDDMGVRRVDYSGVSLRPTVVWACPHPILPSARLVNLDSGTEKLRLSFYKDARWQSVTGTGSPAPTAA